jgi:mevalonate kinase
MRCPWWAGTLEAAPPELAGLAAAAEAALAELGAAASGLCFEVETTMPAGRGLGSSAAAAVALVRAIFAAYGAEPTPEALLALADVAERHAHGTPSGLDAATVALGSPLYFRKGASPTPLASAAPLHFVVADSGAPRDTRSAVTAVRHRLAADPVAGQAALDRLGALAEAAREAIALGDALALGQAMAAAQRQLAEWDVSAPVLDRLIDAAQLAGALGAKLTGAGRGGCILALAQDPAHQQTLRQALLAAGAAEAWPLTLTEGNRP